jgi:hypothetical protein
MPKKRVYKSQLHLVDFCRPIYQLSGGIAFIFSRRPGREFFSHESSGHHVCSAPLFQGLASRKRWGGGGRGYCHANANPNPIALIPILTLSYQISSSSSSSFFGCLTIFGLIRSSYLVPCRDCQFFNHAMFLLFTLSKLQFVFFSIGRSISSVVGIKIKRPGHWSVLPTHRSLKFCQWINCEIQ